LPWTSFTTDFSDLVKVLIECGANVNSQDMNNRTPLHCASEFGYLDTARLLLDHGADANALDNNHVTPIHLASQHGYLEIVQLLLLCGADHDCRDKDACLTPGVRQVCFMSFSILV
jgi:ankyrin repeat protein